MQCWGASRNVVENYCITHVFPHLNKMPCFKSLVHYFIFCMILVGDTNPYTLKPNYENWAPWIGRHTRRSPSVINTEWKKVQTTNTLDNIAEIDMTEERLSDELMKLKVCTSSV